MHRTKWPSYLRLDRQSVQPLQMTYLNTKPSEYALAPRAWPFREFRDDDGGDDVHSS